MSNASGAWALLLTAAMACSGCGGSCSSDSCSACGRSGSPDSPAGEGGREVRRAAAALDSTKDNQAHGSAIFSRENAAVTVRVSLQDAPPGGHAVRVHETGDCSAEDASSAGGHWNPTGAEHGAWGTPPSHLGDIGNVTVAEDGTGSLNLTTDLWSMGTGADNDLLGRAVIVHASPDDFTTQPTAAAGGRIACGVIRE